MNLAKKLICHSPKLARLAGKSKPCGSPISKGRHHSSHDKRHLSCKLVIFDKDGTLMCFSSMWGPWCRVIASRLQNAIGKDVMDDIYRFFNYDKMTEKVGKSALAHETHETLKNNVVNLLVSEHGLELSAATSLVSEAWIDNFDISEIGLEQTIQPLGDVKEIFAVLKENCVKIAVCTSDSRKGAEIALKALGVSDMVDRLVCGDDQDNTPKPAPDNVHMICKDLGVLVEEAAMIGDTHFDTIMGRESKCGAVIGVLSGQGEMRDLEDADYIVKSIEEALPIVLDAFPANSNHSGAHSPCSLSPSGYSGRNCISSSVLSTSPEAC